MTDCTAEDSFWVRCPICNGKTRIKVNKETILVNFPLFCPKCRKETIIDIIQLKMLAHKKAIQHECVPTWDTFFLPQSIQLIQFPY